MIINIKFDKDLELNESIKITLEKEEKKNIEVVWLKQVWFALMK